jgi:hypothetical protein
MYGRAVLLRGGFHARDFQWHFLFRAMGLKTSIASMQNGSQPAFKLSGDGRSLAICAMESVATILDRAYA